MKKPKGVVLKMKSKNSDKSNVVPGIFRFWSFSTRKEEEREKLSGFRSNTPDGN